MTDKFKKTQEKISELYSYTDEVYKDNEEELAMLLVATDKENSTSIIRGSAETIGAMLYLTMQKEETIREAVRLVMTLVYQDIQLNLTDKTDKNDGK